MYHKKYEDQNYSLIKAIVKPININDKSKYHFFKNKNPERIERVKLNTPWQISIMISQIIQNDKNYIIDFLDNKG